MSIPMTAQQRIDTFIKWGVPIMQHKGWENHNRNGHGDWGPVNGIMIHHTGDDAPDKKDFDVLWNGRSDLPGPLCHWGMDDNGVAQMIGNGRTNHAGMGSGFILAQVIRQAGPFTPGPDNIDGNAHFYGQETMYSGNKVPTKLAYHSTILACAAICEFHHWNGKSVIGHKEWTTRKPDPAHVDMNVLRNDVDRALHLGSVNARKVTFL